MKLKITLALLRRTAPPSTGETVLRDSEQTGLSLRIRASGQRIWTYVGSVRGAGGKRRSVALGTFPALGIDEARLKAGELAQAFRAGQDPIAEKQAAEARSGRTLAVAADEFFDRTLKGKKRSATVLDAQWSLNIMKERLGDLPVEDLTRPEVTRFREWLPERLDSATSRVKVFNRLRNVVQREINLGHMTDDPTAGFERLKPSKPRERSLTASEVVQVWNATTQGIEGIRLGLCLPLRRSLLIGLKWSDIDEEARTISIAAEAAGNKSKIATVLPYGDRAAEVLSGLDRGFEYVLPAAFRQNTSRLLKRLEAEIGVAFAIHDLRRTVATIYAERAATIDTDALDRFMLWTPESQKGIRGVYSRASRPEAVQQVALTWDAILSSILKPQGEKVVSLRA